MTSKHSFFKAMWEDLRHKIWLPALSALGYFLLIPVAWLIYWNNYTDDGIALAMIAKRSLMDFFGGYLQQMGALTAVAGALIAGLGSFRFLFHKNMTDTYHSLPIKRRTQFLICYLNGFLAWLVPFTLGILISLCLAGGAFAAGHASDSSLVAEIFLICLKNWLLLILIFLLIYHMVLAAVMFSGNVLNTLVGIGVMGFGVAAAAGLFVAFFELYLSTFTSSYLHMDWALYASPVLSVLWLIFGDVQLEGMGTAVLINVVIMLFLGGAAFVLYLKRPSELAEQGVKNKGIKTLIRLAVGAAAGLSGWLVFTLITDGISAGWGIFGGALFGVIGCGLINMILEMELKAFFAHKLQTAAATVAVLAVGLAFETGWFGYDHYLPDRKDIAEMAVSCRPYQIYPAYYSDRNIAGDPLSEMHLRNTEADYAFLERMAERGLGDFSAYSAKKAKEAFLAQNLSQDNETADRVTVRVTLKSGRTYYRSYLMYRQDKDVAMPVFTDPEYLRICYILPEEYLGENLGLDSVVFRRYDTTRSVDDRKEDFAAKKLSEILAAYKKDVEQNPEAVITGNGRLLAVMEPYLYQKGTYGGPLLYVNLEIYDFMENTKNALEQAGYGNMIAEIPAEEVNAIHLTASVNCSQGQSTQDLLDQLKDVYGIGLSKEEPVGEEPVEEEPVEEGLDSEDREEDVKQFTATAESQEDITAVITDPEEIRELLGLLEYERPDYYSMSALRNRAMLPADVVDHEGEARRCFIKEGVLPEKYIARFEPAVKELLREQNEQ